MAQIGIRELKLHTSEIMRRVRQRNESFQITYRGRVVARITPSAPVESGANDSLWTEMDDLAEEIAADWPADVSAPDAVTEQRH